MMIRSICFRFVVGEVDAADSRRPLVFEEVPRSVFRRLSGCSQISLSMKCA